MAIYVIGTQYNPKQSGIPWTQPGGPGTLVYPQQQLNVAWANYPVPGQFFIESSGLFVCGCGHWVDYPRIYFDQSAYVYAPTYLKDPSGQVWQLGVTNIGYIQTIPVSIATTVTSVLLNDIVGTQTWALSVTNAPSGNLVLTPQPYLAGVPTQLLLLAPDAAYWGLGVKSGDLQTISSTGGSGGQQMALVTCALCTYIQYLMLESQFYDCVQTPTTII